MKDREDFPVTVIVWRGITIQIQYETQYATMRDLHHLDILAVQPPRARLPITETGFLSHFYYGDVVEDVGAEVLKWLEEEAAKPEWKLVEASTKQLTLF